jgi:hypothetical protein
MARQHCKGVSPPSLQETVLDISWLKQGFYGVYKISRRREQNEFNPVKLGLTPLRGPHWHDYDDSSGGNDHIDPDD